MKKTTKVYTAEQLTLIKEFLYDAFITEEDGEDSEEEKD